VEEFKRGINGAIRRNPAPLSSSIEGQWPLIETRERAGERRKG